ncbi:hypothetical protein Q1695_006998 [Nippostrongylus brasiliensis]|nr:hypothetical protein Q1695_006998 [Nippostrongylus brasiliensis]
MLRTQFSESYGTQNCEGCVRDVKCALRKTLERSQRFAMGDVNAISTLSWHLGPQNWHCDFRDNLKNFKLVHYSPTRKDKLAEDLRALLKEGKVDNSDIELIAFQISNGTTKHATSHLHVKAEFNEQMQDDEVKRLLIKIFFWDYILLNFPLPDVKM